MACQTGPTIFFSKGHCCAEGTGKGRSIMPLSIARMDYLERFVVYRCLAPLPFHHLGRGEEWWPDRCLALLSQLQVGKGLTQTSPFGGDILGEDDIRFF